MQKTEKPANPPTNQDVDDDEPDAWCAPLHTSHLRAGSEQRANEVFPRDKRIEDTGCSAENERLNNCFYEKKDWRKCKDEMQAFRECWEVKGNVGRTGAKNN
ncbi:hypothetical protein RUND412_000066 [Rhizina undulata]